MVEAAKTTDKKEAKFQVKEAEYSMDQFHCAGGEPRQYEESNLPEGIPFNSILALWVDGVKDNYVYWRVKVLPEVMKAMQGLALGVATTVPLPGYRIPLIPVTAGAADCVLLANERAEMANALYDINIFSLGALEAETRKDHVLAFVYQLCIYTYSLYYGLHHFLVSGSTELLRINTGVDGALAPGVQDWVTQMGKARTAEPVSALSTALALGSTAGASSAGPFFGMGGAGQRPLPQLLSGHIQQSCPTRLPQLAIYQQLPPRVSSRWRRTSCPAPQPQQQQQQEPLQL
jgi:hypothetical protein